MNERQRDLQGAVAAHRALEAQLVGFTDHQAAAPSRLPDWSMGHVLTHIARNADGVRNMLDGAQRGEVAPQYPGGFEQRSADIVAGAVRGAAALVADVRDSNARLEASLAAMTDEAWQGEGLTVVGPAPIADLPFRRWRETVVHHADLGLDYTWRDWPVIYVRVELHRQIMLWNSRQSMGLTGLPAPALAADEHLRLAWLLGRADIDGLGPAGLMK
jgi:maleylpyruvate isomerase